MTAESNPLFVLVGAPGSGKSTWAKRYFPARQIVSSDELRGRIGDSPNDQRANQYAFKALHAIVAGRMELNQFTVVDATHRTAKMRQDVAEHAIRWSRPKFLVVFTTSLQTCLARNALRRGPRRVPEDWLTATHAMIAEALPPATTHMPDDYSGVLFVPEDGPGCVGGLLDMKRWASSPWLDVAREEPPPWWDPSETYPGLHHAGWGLRQAPPTAEIVESDMSTG